MDSFNLYFLLASSSGKWFQYPIHRPARPPLCYVRNDEQYIVASKWNAVLLPENRLFMRMRARVMLPEFHSANTGMNVIYLWARIIKKDQRERKMSRTIFDCLENEMACLISQAQVSWGKLLTECRCYEMVVKVGKNIIYADENESNPGDDMNWNQTVRPKFNHQFILNELGSGCFAKYLVLKSSCHNFSTNVLWTQWSGPWAVAAVKKLTALLLT